MMSFLFFSSKVEQAWFFGSMVIITAMVMHSFARPFEDDLIDICEFLSLVSLLFIQQSALVFKVIDDPANPDLSNGGRILSSALKYMSLIMIAANCILAMVVEVRVWQHVTDGDEDYKVKMTRQKMEALQDELDGLESVLERAVADAEAYAKRKAHIERLKLGSLSLSNLGSLSSDGLHSGDSTEDVGEAETALENQDPTASFDAEKVSDEGGAKPKKKKKKLKTKNDEEVETFANPLDSFLDSVADGGEGTISEE